MKNFVIEVRTNPTDKWVRYRCFKELERAEQSLEMLKKHNLNTISHEYIYSRYRKSYL